MNIVEALAEVSRVMTTHCNDTTQRRSMNDEGSTVDHDLAVAGLVIALPGLIQTCVHIVGRVRVALAKLHDAPNDIEDLLLRARVAAEKSDMSVKTLNHIANALPFSISSLLSQLLDRLQATMRKLQTTTGNLTPGLMTQDTLSRDHISRAWMKDSISHCVDQIDRWQREFDSLITSLAFSGRLPQMPSTLESSNRLYSVVRRTNTFRDAYLARLPTSTYNGLHSTLPDTARQERVPYTNIYLPALPQRAEHHVLTEECTPTAHTPPDAVQRLAEILHTADPETMSLLQCVAFRGQYLSFHVPKYLSQEPLSLRQILLETNGQPRHSLDQRLGVLTQLATALHFIHITGNVHKQFRPDNILVFRRQSEKGAKDVHKSLQHAFLVGFDLARGIGTESGRTGPAEFHKNIYLAQDRQGTQVHPRKFSQWDDIYSFGVVALELALWMSFITHSDGTKPSAKPLVLAPLLTGRTPAEIYVKFCKSAKNDIPTVLGQSFAEMVYDCLTCLKPADQNTMRQKLRADVERPGAGAEYILQQLMTLTL